MTYAPNYDLGSGKFLGVTASDGTIILNDPTSQAWQTFLVWYSQQSPASFTFADQVVVRRTPRAPAQIIADISNLTAAQQTQLFNAWRLSALADFLIQHPNFANALGISVAGDQP